DGENQKLTALGLGADWRNRNVRLSADFGVQQNDTRGIRPSVEPAATGVPLVRPPDASSNYAQPWTFANSRDIFGTLRGEVDVNDKITAWAAFGGRHGEEDNSLANPTLTDTAGNTSTYRFDNHRKEIALTGEVGVRGKFDTGPVGHTVTVAANAFSLKERNAFAFSDFAGFAGNLYNPTVVAPPPATAFLGGVLDNPTTIGDTQITSLAVSDTLSFMQDKLLLTLGARYQKMDTTDYFATGGAIDTAYSKHSTSPMAGVVFKLSPQLSLFGNYIEGLVKGKTVSPTPGVSVTFAPAVAQQKEIGAKYEAGPLGASVSYFTTRKPDAYVIGGVAGEFGQQRNRGIEFNVYGQATRGLRLLGGVTLLDARQVSSAVPANNGRDVIGVPNYQFNVGADWDVPGVRGLALDTRVLRTGRQYADATN
ncbi:MAG: TonB-dependent receptor, partial [Lysobacteraceae bacterium]